MEGDKTPTIKYSCKQCGERSSEMFCKLACEITYRKENANKDESFGILK